MRVHQMKTKAGKAQAQAWAFLSVVWDSIFLVVCESMIMSAATSSASPVIEELDREEKQMMISQLLEEGDRYLKEKNYNLANASYESVFLLEANHLEASQRIDRLKKRMVQEGKSETELVTRVYDAEIEGRVQVYLKEAKQLISEQKLNQARFTLQKLLLVNPLNEEARKLYDDLGQSEQDATL